MLIITLDGTQQNNSVILATKRGLVLVDTNTSQSYGREIRQIARKEFGRDDFAFVINTHDNLDHTGGNQAFADAVIIGHSKCYETMKEQQRKAKTLVEEEHKWTIEMLAQARERLARTDAGSEAAERARNAEIRWQRYSSDLANGFIVTPPTLAFDDRLLLELGDLTVRILYFGRAHTQGDVLVYVPEEKILMTGDLSFDTGIVGQRSNESYPRYRGTLDVPRWLEVLHEVLDIGPGVATVVEGHARTHPGEWLAERRRYLKDLWEGVLAAKAGRQTLEQATERLSLDRAFPYVKKWEPRIDGAELVRRHTKLLEIFWEQVAPAGSNPVAKTRFQPLGVAEIFAPGTVSTGSTEVKVTFSPDGSRMLWGTIGRAGGKGGWDIFESKKEASGWSAPRPVSFNSAANDFDPFFAPDESGVYFFSNRDGGFGKDDLWFVPFKAASGEYGEAKNLGAGVNTAGDEWAPVLSPDGTRLLFASDGRGGEGKHDLFIATRSPDGTWGSPQNLGQAVNSAEEDFDATFLHDGRTIVFSSGNLEGPDVHLFVVYDRGWGYEERTLLPPVINTPGTWTFGPSISPAEPGVLYFTTKRKDGAGGMDIYRIRYELK